MKNKIAPFTVLATLLLSVIFTTFVAVRIIKAETINTEAQVLEVTIKVGNEGRMSFLLQPNDTDEAVWLTAPYRTEKQVMDTLLYAYNRKEKVFICYDNIEMKILFIKATTEW